MKLGIRGTVSNYWFYSQLFRNTKLNYCWNNYDDNNNKYNKGRTKISVVCAVFQVQAQTHVPVQVSVSNPLIS